VQWVQAYGINVGLLSTIFQALGKEFGDYTVYRTGADLLVVATKAQTLPPLSADVFKMPGLAQDLRYLGFQELGDLQALRLGGRKALHPLFSQTGYLPNSDYFPILDQRAPRARFKAENSEELPRIRDNIVPVLALLDGEWPTPLARIQSAGNNRPLRLDRTLMGAEAIGVMLTGAGDQARTLGLPDRNAAILAHSLMDKCDGAKGEWLDALTQVVRLSTPYLTRPEVAVMFDKARASRCYKSLDEFGRRHVAWLQAINDRNAEAMFAQGEYLFDNTPPEIAADRGMYLLSAITGALASGRIDDARRLRDTQLPKLPRAQRDNLALTLVLAHLALVAPSNRQ
jgi:hypothetical protein